MEEGKIKVIRKYLSYNGVKYYDVQAELIDHFASAVEDIEKEKPHVSFKDALSQAHQSFGGREGFHKYLEQAEKSVQRKTWKLMGKVLLQFVKWPYLFITGFLALSWYFVLSLNSLSLNWLLGGVLIAFLGVMLFNYLKLRKVRMFLPLEANRALGWVFYLLFYIPGQPLLFREQPVDVIYPWLYFTFFSLAFVAFYKVPHLALRETEKLYPRLAQQQ